MKISGSIFIFLEDDGYYQFVNWPKSLTYHDAREQYTYDLDYLYDFLAKKVCLPMNESEFPGYSAHPKRPFTSFRAMGTRLPGRSTSARVHEKLLSRSRCSMGARRLKMERDRNFSDYAVRLR